MNIDRSGVSFRGMGLILGLGLTAAANGMIIRQLWSSSSPLSDASYAATLLAGAQATVFVDALSRAGFMALGGALVAGLLLLMDATLMQHRHGTHRRDDRMVSHRRHRPLPGGH